MEQELKQYFTGEWYDIGNVQVPNGMKFKEVLGTNPEHPDDPVQDLGQIEAVHLDKEYIPPEEHEKFLNEWGVCWHAFSRTAHSFMLYWEDVSVTRGKYKLTMELCGDYVGEGTDKPPVEDPEHAKLTLFVGDGSCSTYINRNSNQVIEREIDITEDATINIGFDVFVQWAQSSESWANGCFIKSFTFEYVAPLGELYNIFVLLIPQEATLSRSQEIVEDAFKDKRTFMYSADDALYSLQNPRADSDSKVYVVDMHMPSQQRAIALFDASGVPWEAYNG